YLLTNTLTFLCCIATDCCAGLLRERDSDLRIGLHLFSQLGTIPFFTQTACGIASTHISIKHRQDFLCTLPGAFLLRLQIINDDGARTDSTTGCAVIRLCKLVD